MKSKKLLSLLLALAMVMSMAACGAKTNEPPATSGTPSETGAPATEELNWPTKEITLIQPWSLGGGPDVITRQIASYSDKILGVPMIVENHTGGSGTIGMNDFLEAEDDGYTLFCCNGPLFSLTPSFIDGTIPLMTSAPSAVSVSRSLSSSATHPARLPTFRN